MLDNTKEVQGVGVYAEFRKPGATMQMIVTPDGYTSDGKRVPANLFRRVVTPASPKKQWRNSPIPHDKFEEMAGEDLALFQFEEYASTRLSSFANLFDAISNGSWQIVNKPFHLEVSKKDLDDVRSGKTPTKMLYRIGLVRKEQNFPEDLIAAA